MAVAAGGVNPSDGDLKAAAFGRRVSTSSCARKLVLNEESKKPAPTATRPTTTPRQQQEGPLIKLFRRGRNCRRFVEILGDARQFFVFYSGLAWYLEKLDEILRDLLVWFEDC